MNAEQWRWVPGYEGEYEVSSRGQVCSWRVRDPKLMKGFTDKDGYRIVQFRRPGGERRPFRVAVLVLTTFVGERPDGYLACHNDGACTNDTVENLRWDTPKANARDQLRHGTSKLYNTHCVNGHEYTPENTGPGRQGAMRSCLTCKARRLARKSSGAIAERRLRQAS